MIEFGHHLAGTVARVDLKADLPGLVDARLAGEPQGLQSPHPAFVAAAPGLHAFADPDFFLLPELVELAVVDRLDFELFGLFGLICGEIALIFAQLATIELDDAVGDVVQKAPIVGDEQQRALEVVEQAFQPFDRREVEMVGGLVQQQQLGVGDQRARQRNAFLEPAGQGVDRAVGVQAQALQGFLHPAVESPGVGHFEFVRQPFEVGVHRLIAFRHRMRHGMVLGQQRLRRADAFGHRLEHRMSGLELRLLRHIGQPQGRRAPHLAGIRLSSCRR